MGPVALRLPRRIVDVVDVLAASLPIRPLAPCLQRLGGWMSGDQPLTAADEIRAAGLDQRLAHLEVVLRLEELQEGPLQLAVAHRLCDVDLLLRERIDPGVIHALRNVERRWDEV